MTSFFYLQFPIALGLETENSTMPTPRFLHFFPETKYKAKLEETLLCLGSFWTMLICLTYWVLSFFYNYQEATSLGALLGGLAYLGLFLWIKFRAFSPWLSFIYILISLCLLDGLWMMVGGIYSDLPILLLLAFFTSMMISAKGWLWLAMLLNFSNFAFLLVLHLYFPESINYHPPAAEVAFTSFTSLGVALFSIWVLMGILKERYQLSQEQLEQKNMALIDASQAKSQFLAQMSHEIRTPMNGMLGMAQLLLDSPLSEEQQEYAQTLKQSGEQLLQIVNEILDYSKLEAGGWHLQEQEFELERSVEEAMNIAVSRALAKGLSLRYFPDAHLPDQLIGDATKIRQMLLNLLDNAIKFSHQGCISIYMSKLREEEDRVWVEFRLTDQGVGIPQAKQSDLFKEFSQLSNQQAHSNSGTGLGLAIVRQLAEQMGGQVGVDSEEGQGASFYFRLPLQKVASKSASLFKGKRLFLLSKNKDAARFFEAICQRWEMEYFQFWEPDASHEAVELGIIPAPDFVFFDSQLQDPTEILSWPCPQFLLLALGEERKLSRNFQAQLSAPLRPLRIKQLLLKQMSVVQEEKEEGPSLPWTNKRVLLAEDNKINQRLMQQVLERMGLKLHIVQNGQEALDFLAQEEVDLILMDLQMPILDGRKASQAIRAQQINTPIIALSGEEEKAIEGINGFLQKPIELEQLEACLRQFFC